MYFYYYHLLVALGLHRSGLDGWVVGGRKSNIF